MQKIRKPISSRRLVFYAALFFAVLTSSTLMAVGKGGPAIEKVRVGQHNQTTRVVLESNTPLEPRIFTLRSPNRVVLDFPEINFSRSLASVNQPPKSLVTNMREGLFKPGVTRMVLDVKQPVAIKKFNIGESEGFGYRIVLDLTPTAKPTPAVTEKIIPSIKKAEAPKAKRQQATIKLPPVQPAPKKKGDPIVVMIDPGHGGVDPGAVTRSHVYEKHIVLSVAKRMQKELNNTHGYKAYLTRDKDIYIPLAGRVKKAQEVNADIFISIHADAHRNRKVRGGSVYVLSEKSSDKEAARLAAHANRGDIVAGLDLSEEQPEVRDILIDLTQRETLNKSTILAKDVIQKLRPVVRLRKKTPLYAGFRVLKAPEIPSILVELAYLSNSSDEKNLRSPTQQRKMAKALSDGVQAFARKNIHR